MDLAEARSAGYIDSPGRDGDGAGNTESHHLDLIVLCALSF